MPHATFVLSTGRCGTQWLAQHLSSQGLPNLAVEHEPLHDRYQARLMLGAESPFALEPALAAPILEHAAAIEKRLEAGGYIECGHPCWSSLPWLAKRFEGRMRVIHLARHPVPTACSWLTHQAYCPPLLPHLREKILLSPFDAGVQFPEYQERWASLAPFEKALYYWTELNAFGLRWEKELGVPWLRVSYEDLFGGSGLAAVHAFLGIPNLAARLETRVDRFHYVSPEMQDWQATVSHPHAVETARLLGYDPLAVDATAMRQRYVGA